MYFPTYNHQFPPTVPSYSVLVFAVQILLRVNGIAISVASCYRRFGISTSTWIFIISAHLHLSRGGSNIKFVLESDQNRKNDLESIESSEDVKIDE